MKANATCDRNGTNTCGPGSSTGLAVGLPLFFLVLVIACVIVYRYHRKIRDMIQFRQQRRHKKEDYSETTQGGAHQYSTMHREESVAQTPIYENVTRTTGYDRPAVIQSRSADASEEDVYLQCDMTDDAIYGNDPKCNLEILPDCQEEDVYIVPDS
ncbi:hypothetical protein EXN66_Car014866 [Channa argus]|uniref:Uncharacterized protein n=1 Tax=Channa argus TaxID=215402 RepID=A0A6G1Q9T8_CHAAH|nr:hypothetical protein EXN66_Car014866 [Channa argus]KAK2895459.1 hypothetical protein Q8A73_014947 [Channa argus]